MKVYSNLIQYYWNSLWSQRCTRKAQRRQFEPENRDMNIEFCKDWIKSCIFWAIGPSTHYWFFFCNFAKVEDLTTFFMSTWWGDSMYMKKIESSKWLFEGRLRQGKNLLSYGLNWLCYFAGNSKSYHENSISFIFLESPHQVDMKNVVKC